MANKLDVIEYIKQNFTRLRAKKAYWTNIYDLVGYYINYKRERFQDIDTPGEFLTEQIFDNTVVTLNKVMASTILNMLYPSANKSFRLKPSHWLSKNQEILNYFSKISDLMSKYMDKPESKFYYSLTMLMEELGAFGTSGIGVQLNDDKDELDEIPLIYKAYDLKRTFIDENERGVVDTFYYYYEYTIVNLVNYYGLKNVSKQVQDYYKKGELSKKIMVLRVIEPTKNIYRNKKKGKHKIASIHLEYENMHILKESGFDDSPIVVARFEQRIGEVQGRCPGINAISDIVQANAVKESIMMATEKNLDPALAVLEGSLVGFHTDVDTSPGAINVFSASGNVGVSPITQIQTVGDISAAERLLVTLYDSLVRHFHLDRLLDLQNTREMTFGEAQIRREDRGRTQGTTFARIEIELFTPIIKKSFNLLFENGLLGVVEGSKEEQELLAKNVNPANILYIPEEVQDIIESNLEVYEIEYISPAARMRQNDEIIGATTFFQTILTAAQVNPEIFDNINLDFYLRKLADLFNVDSALLQGLDRVKQIREQRQALSQTAQQLEFQKLQTENKRDNAMANSMNAKAIQGGV